MRPNWFLAFPLDGAFVEGLPEVPRGFRRYHPADVHLTLAFLGPCGEPAAERAWTCLENCLMQAPRAAFSVSLASVVAMGPPRAYSALSALLGEGREAAEALIHALRDPPLEVALGRRDKRPPKPHITLARPMRKATEAERAAGLTWASGLQLGQVRQSLERVALYTWNEQRRERLFKIVAERALAPANQTAANASSS
jgi:RNA 2',3'-cyclic 3'-phosphodiesterase